MKKKYKSEPPNKQETESILQELASLDSVDYDRCRHDKAKELGLQLKTVDTEVDLRRPKTSSSSDTMENELKPWPEPVDGLALLQQVYRTIKDHCIISNSSAVAISLWVLLTYSYDAFRILPILTLISPVKRCGKTTLLSVLNGLVFNGIMASNISSAATYRMIEKFKPTLLADEADTFFKQNEELRGVFNSGHCKESAFIVRCDGDSNEPVKFSTWSPKALAMISSLAKLPGTIADRSVIVQMSRKKSGERIQRKSLSFYDDNRMLRRMLLRWGMDATPELQKTEIKLPDLGNDRMTDNWIPLATIAHLLYEDWYNKAVEAMKELSGCHADADDSIAILILEDIRTIFETQHVEKLSSQEIVDNLGSMDDRPWPEFKNGKPLTKAGLARLLKPFKIKPTTIRTGGTIAKGYLLEVFQETFSRYIPPLQSVTPEQSPKNNYLGQIATVTQTNNVTVNMEDNHKKSLDCYVVTDVITSPGEEIKRSELKI